MEDADEPRVALTGLMLQPRLEDGSTESVKPTVPARPCKLVTVMVELARVPARTVTDAGLATIVKSCIVNRTVAWCDREPLIPVSVTVYTPADPLHERLDVADTPSTTEVELRVQVRPDDGETEEVRVTVPVKLLMLAIVILEVPPLAVLRELGAGVKTKS